MANEIFKEIKTKIALKTLSYAEWDAIKDTYKPLKGEVCVCTIPEGNAAATTAPTVMFKVGDGTNFFGALKWVSALAADVYGWAKENALFIHKDGTGNVVSGVEWDASLNGGKGGVKYTTAAVATAEGLEDLQEKVDTLEKEVYGEDGSAENSRIDKLEKDIADNRDAWNKYEDTRYFFSTDGDKLVVTKRLYTNGAEGAEEAVGTYEFLTADEVAETLKGYYTKSEADAKFVTGLAEGATNGTIKTIVNGVSGADVKVHGLQDAAYATVASLNETAQGYANVVLGTAGDTETANTVYGAKAAAAKALEDAKKYADEKPHENTAHTHTVGAGLKVTGNGGISGDVEYALNVAFELVDKTIKLYDKNDSNKTALATLDATEFIADGMLASVTADQANNKLVFEWNTDAGVTKTEIELDAIADIYTGSIGNEVNIAVSNQNVISASLNSDVATKIAHGEEAYGWGNHASQGYAKTIDLGDLAGKDKIVEGDIEGTIGVGKITNFATEVAAVKVTNAGHADSADEATHAVNADNAADAAKLGGQLPSHYATAESVTDIAKDNGTIDSKISAYDAGKNFGDIITHNVAEFATSAQGEKANSALQEITTTANNGLKVTNKNNIDIDTDVVFVLDCNW